MFIADFPHGKAVFAIPHTKQAAIFYSDFRCTANKMVTHTKGKSAGQRTILQRILQSPNGNAPGIRPQTKQGKNTFFRRRKPDGFIAYHGNDIILSNQISHCPIFRKKLQRLIISYRMIQPLSVQAAVDHKFPISQL